MGYREALEAAGAEVLDFKEFGSYQGEWAAFVKLYGEECVIMGYYGSCSGCDAFQAEFSYDGYGYERNGKYYDKYYEECTKDQFEAAQVVYKLKLAEFGKTYLTNPYTLESLKQKRAALDNRDWLDSEEAEVIDWCLNHFK